MQPMTFGDLVHLMGDLGVVAEWDLPPSIASLCQRAFDFIEATIKHGQLAQILASIDTDEKFIALLRTEIALTLLDSDTQLALQRPAAPYRTEKGCT
ncbi:hypothetical protein [Pandoraea terrigena]|uniref:Uncharacterized protein n=1 Tax=Pandoraea terrigena TaxID=2508292 RepID=A0A5E4YE94_9BURK|nr:hypothetical protein [Pandoraea terrigena]VVE46800.1 hypothetical protein PTE31013_04482 [Pandoraea terrigena]